MILDLSDPVHRIRLAVADTADPLVFPQDEVYQGILDKNNGNESATIKEMAGYILGQLAYGTRQRLDRIETYGHQAFEQYLKFLNDVIRSQKSGMSLAGIYAAGISIADIEANQSDPDIVQRRMPWGPNGEYSPITNPFDCDSSSF